MTEAERRKNKITAIEAKFQKQRYWLDKDDIALLATDSEASRRTITTLIGEQVKHGESFRDIEKESIETVATASLCSDAARLGISTKGKTPSQINSEIMRQDTRRLLTDTHNANGRNASDTGG